MFDGIPVVVCIPAGRKRTLTPLLYHLRAMGDLIDRIDLWENTTVPSDLEFIHSQVDDKTKVVPLSDGKPRRQVTNDAGERQYARDNSRFYRNYTDPTPIYIRIDDDVVWLHPQAIRQLVKVRLENPHPLLVSANVWNNAVFTHFHQRAGNLSPEEVPPVAMFCMDQVGWANGDVAVTMHRILLGLIEFGGPETLFLSNRPITRDDHVVQFSTNCIAINGRDMIDMAEPIWGQEEESWLMHQAQQNKASPLLAGKALVAHYSFWKQRPTLDQTDILDRYTRIAEATYHDAYYRLMGFE